MGILSGLETGGRRERGRGGVQRSEFEGRQNQKEVCEGKRKFTGRKRSLGYLPEKLVYREEAEQDGRLGPGGRG